MKAIPGRSLDEAGVDPVLHEQDPASSETTGGHNLAASRILQPSLVRGKHPMQDLLSSGKDSRSMEDEASDVDVVQESKKQGPAQRIEAIQLPALIYPKSRYRDYDPSPPNVSLESDALDQALAYSESHGSGYTSHGNEEFHSIEFDDFSIYHPARAQLRSKGSCPEESPTSNELMGLHEKDNRGVKHWLLDGWICYGATRKYVQGIFCETLSIGGYQDTRLHTVGSALWVQSAVSLQKSAVWYCLKRPTPEYSPYHVSFLWLADCAKHIVDYLDNHDNVGLHHFRQDFCEWTLRLHGTDQTFQRWLRTYSNTDFCCVLTAHARFLFLQAVGVDKAHAEHPLWAEIDPDWMNAIPRQTDETTRNNSKRTTIVTSYVYECFKDFAWADFLKVQNPAFIQPWDKQVKSPSRVSFHKTFNNDIAAASSPALTGRSHSQGTTISIGEVVAVKSDSNTNWTSTDSLWYGYVQGTTVQGKGTKLDLLWLYRPSDTPCGNMYYPFSKELFLSNHCNCGDEPIYAHEIVATPEVAFKGDEHTRGVDFFVRQKYDEADEAWTTLSHADFKCICKQPKTEKQYHVGDTWLVVEKSSQVKEGLEPVEIMEVFPATVKVRRLQRLGRDYQVKDADPNELVYSSVIEDIPTDRFFRLCYIRFYTVKNRRKRQIPTPYCRGGTADFYYISHLDYGALEVLRLPYPTSLNQGFDPSAQSHPAMSGLGLFSGGGSFDRGLEDGGALDMKWAVDLSREAVHTYRANHHDPKNVKIFFGSVNEYLTQAMKGNRGKQDLIAQKGQVDIIVAGHPCQGFSAMNQNKGNDKSLANSSMIASVVAYIDYYRPKYAILENVLGMAICGLHDRKRNNVLEQVRCALVGMGYQFQSSILDAWNYGAPQSRSRIFISVAAAGLTPLPSPPHTHSHPPGVKARALGKSANGLPLGTRYWDLTPFEYVTIKEATKDLPLNQHGKLTCIRHPDHRLSRQYKPLDQGIIESIPKHPSGMNFIKAYKQGVMPKPQIKAHDWHNPIRSSVSSKNWQRVIPNALIHTITTTCKPEDGIAGFWLHWEADRPISILEARRAQGFPDHEPILGSEAAKWKIIGNSVARQVATALGVALRHAWLANNDLEPVGTPAEDRTVVDENEEDTVEAYIATAASTPKPLDVTLSEELMRTQIAEHHRQNTSPAKRLRSSASEEYHVQLPKKRRGERWVAQRLPTRLREEAIVDEATDERVTDGRGEVAERGTNA